MQLLVLILISKRDSTSTMGNARVADARGAAKLVGLLLDLHCQLASGSKHENCWPVVCWLACRLHMQESWQQEPTGLAAASLGNGHNIPALDCNWPGLRLDWCGLLVACPADLATGRTRQVCIRGCWGQCAGCWLQKPLADRAARFDFATRGTRPASAATVVADSASRVPVILPSVCVTATSFPEKGREADAGDGGITACASCDRQGA